VDAITEIPPDRWNKQSFYDPEPGTPGKTYARWGGFVDGIDQFDAEFFGISPREAAHMDPQQRMLLEVSYEAIEDGGLRLDELAGSSSGVFIGISTSDYGQIQSSIEDRSTIDTHTTTGGVMSIAANRISYAFDLRGPSVAVDTACSSSLVAIHLGCQSIWNRESTIVLAGGVNVIIIPDPYIGFSKLSMLSTEGRCKTFDESGDGFVRAEGVGIVVLKPLAQALADRDQVYAVIRSTVVNQDGKTNGITVPNPDAQAAMLREACRQAGIPAHAIQYVEAHGTGTAVGDPLETTALGEVLAVGRKPNDPCFVGSVKTNIGHLEAGAGIAGLIKTALSLKYGQITPNLHFRNPNPLVDFERLKLRVPTQLEPWPARKGKRYAGVNSFGFGGTNAHVLLSDAPSRRQKAASTPPARQWPYLVPLSARSPEALKALAKAYTQQLGQWDGTGSPSLDDLCFTLGARRSHFDHRLTVVARTKEELADKLLGFAESDTERDLNTGHGVSKLQPKLAFLFSGQGTQWWAMGRQLFDHEPLFRTVVEECDKILRGLAPWSLAEELTREEAHTRLHETSIAQPCLFALQAGLCALWKSWGIEPDGVAGHSVGEITAAYVAGILSLEDAVCVIYHRGRCMDLASSLGRMVAAAMTEKEARTFVAGLEDRVSIAAVNSPASVTLSGDADTLAQIQEALDRQHIFHKPLRVNYAFHSPQMDAVREELLKSLVGITPRTASKLMISTVTGKPAEGMSCDAEYWWQNVRQSVRFGDTVLAFIDIGFRMFVEVGPHPVLSAYVLESLSSRQTEGVVVPSLRREQDEQVQMMSSLGALYAHGYPIALSSLYPTGRFLKLPSYPWQHQPYWHESESVRTSRLGLQAHPLLGKRLVTADPSWKVELNRVSHSYLHDHRVHGHVVFPAAGYIEMALAAARELFGTGTYVLEEIEFPKALFLPDGGDSVTVQTTFYRQGSTFSIASRTGNAPDQWSVHARGTMRLERENGGREVIELTDLRTRCPEQLSPHDTYSKFSDHGLFFGPSFRGIVQVYRGHDEAYGVIEPPHTIAEELPTYLLHPALLDPCLQVLSEVRADKPGQLQPGTPLPVGVASVRVFGSARAGVRSHARATAITPRSVEGDIIIVDNHGTLLATIRGLKAQSVEMQSTAVDNPDNWIYEYSWKVQESQDRTLHRRSVDYLPSADILHRHLREIGHHLADSIGWGERTREVEADIDMLCTGYIVRAFENLGWDMQPGNRMQTETLLSHLSVLPKFSRLFAQYLGILADDGILRQEGSDWVVVKREHTEEHELVQRYSTILQHFPAIHPELMLLDMCGRNLAAVLSGSIDPLQVLFPEGSTTRLSQFYYGSPAFRWYNAVAAEAVGIAAAHLPEDRTIRLLEIGAGTGSLTAHILPLLPAQRSRYVFTDISPLFVQQATETFHDHTSAEFKVLDIERDIAAQGFAPHSFDVIIASDVLHATADLRQSLSEVRALLAPGGMLILIEAAKAPRWVSLVFGLTEGWWKFTDHELRPSFPTLSQEGWVSLLGDQGFVQPFALSDPTISSAGHQFVCVALGPSHISALERPVAPSPGTTEASSQSSWLIFDHDSGPGDTIANALSRAGDLVTFVHPGKAFNQRDGRRYEVSPEQPGDFDQLLHNIAEQDGTYPTGVVHCWVLKTPPPGALQSEDLERAESLGCHSVMHLLQAWDRLQVPDAPRLYLLTCNAQPVGKERTSLSLAQSPLIGLGRVIANEHPEYRCKMIDVDPLMGDEAIRALLDEIRCTDDEDEVVLRSGERYVPRITRSSLRRCSQNAQRVRSIPADPIRLEAVEPGVIENLRFREARRQSPAPGEVEIRVVAASLNFRDVLKTLGIYPNDTLEIPMLGDECAGVVTAVGEGVTGFLEGDEVIAISRGSFSSYVTTDSAAVVKKPAHLRFEEAVTIPVAFLTAYYSLHHLARIGVGDTVLVHAATGGVGLAALQIAQLAGAEVYATAGNPEKRALLKALGVKHVMDSRSLTFAEEIRQATGGRGVDIVLNSLAGEAILKGLQCLAPYGRFLEIGKRDIYQNSRLAMRAFKNNISFFAIDLERVTAEKPTLISELFEELMEHFKAGRLHPLLHSVFPLIDAPRAFRLMWHARHIGKIVLSLLPQTLPVEHQPSQRLHFRADATYLITGGLGGFGLSIARWMVERGSRYLALTGRKGAVTAEASTAIADLERQGVTVRVIKGDVSKEEEVAQALEDIGKTMPPLRGVMHAAMVLDDGILLHLDSTRFRAVMAPKVTGAWNLHRLTAGIHLDHFVLFSSATTMHGNRGQGNYVAANTFLDALAHYRRSNGLPALTVSWGQIADAGFVARNADIARHLEYIGLQGISANQAARVLEQLLLQEVSQVAVAKVDWRLWPRLITGTPSPRYSLVLNTATGEEASARSGEQIRDALLAASPKEQRSILKTYITAQLARVLGTTEDNILPEKPLNELGIDSLMTVEMKNRIEKQTGLSVPTVALMRGPTIETLVEALIQQLSGSAEVDQHAQAITKHRPAEEEERQKAEATLENINQLSESEIDALLSSLADNTEHAAVLQGKGTRRR
jgi:acyl transferase domain-containing protein/NADPH:quinone reductase-like Zn-dependent oxidoreductase/SAM-dependent methyltransferase/acyl carrier protein